MRHAIWFVGFWFGCHAGEATSPTADPARPVDTDRAPIADDAIFDPDHVVAIDLVLAPADWEELRSQSRDLMDIFGGEDCLADPFESPFDTWPADLVVDGEVVSQVGLSKKGFLGSLSSDKPALKIDVDEFVDGQRLADGTERIVLNNAVQDPSYVSACLGYQVFADAGVPAPRCNFAHVTVNGEDLGIYVHVEAIKKDFLARHFASADGDLYEGTLSDFVETMNGTFEADTDDTDASAPAIAALTAALDLPDDDLLDAVSALVDLPAFYRFWAAESLVAHWDGYASNTNNFYVYVAPDTGLMSFIPWGADGLFGDPATPVAFTHAWLARRLWGIPEGRAGYLAALDEMLDRTFDADTLSVEVDRMGALIAPHLDAPDTAATYQEYTRGFLAAREEALRDAIPSADALPVEADPPSAAAWCLVSAGLVTGSFDTTWDSLASDPFAGPAATLAGELLPSLSLTGAVAGPDGKTGEPLLALVGVTPDGVDLWEIVVFLPPDASPGAFALDFGATTAVLVHVDLTDPYDEGEYWLILGTLQLEAFATTPGAAVVGTIDGELFDGLL